MTVDELLARFPQIPADLREEPVLGMFADTFGDHLLGAEKPSACAADHTAENLIYLKLLGPVDIHAFGLFSRDRLIQELDNMVKEHGKDPEEFVSKMLAGVLR